MAYGAMANEQLEAQEVFRELVTLSPTTLYWVCSYLRMWQGGLEGWRPPVTVLEGDVAASCARIMQLVFPERSMNPDADD